MYFPHSLLRCSWLWMGNNLYFGITYSGFIPRTLPVFAVGPQHLHRYFYLCQKYHLNDTNIIFKQIQYRFKIWMGSVGQIFIELETSFIRGFRQLSLWCPLRSNLCRHTGGHSMTTEACTSLARVCVVWRSGSSLELSALCRKNTKVMISMLAIHW